jgi:hypothetical protein
MRVGQAEYFKTNETGWDKYDLSAIRTASLLVIGNKVLQKFKLYYII